MGHFNSKNEKKTETRKGIIRYLFFETIVWGHLKSFFKLESRENWDAVDYGK